MVVAARAVRVRMIVLMRSMTVITGGFRPAGLSIGSVDRCGHARFLAWFIISRDLGATPGSSFSKGPGNENRRPGQNGLLYGRHDPLFRERGPAPRGQPQ